jgi:activator of 2-hydroxyglutaryl-CoA dehydratase
MADKLQSLGLCLGASTISLVHMKQALDGNGDLSPRIITHFVHTHEGDPKRSLIRALKGIDMHSFDRIAVTGRKFRRFVNLTSLSEPEAVEYAYAFVKPPAVDCPAVVSAGGETFMVYMLNPSGRKCASGTGEFFMQQLRRMNVNLVEAARWAEVETPYHVSGRCSVFCKSDCTHATNKGVPKPQVTSGLCKMMADKILELLKKVERHDIMIIGGTAKNRMMIDYLRREIPGLIVPEAASYLEALGAALWALSRERPPSTACRR